MKQTLHHFCTTQRLYSIDDGIALLMGARRQSPNELPQTIDIENIRPF